MNSATILNLDALFELGSLAADSITKIITMPRTPYFEIGSPYEIIIDIETGKQVTDYTILEFETRRQKLLMCEWGVKYQVEIVCNTIANTRDFYIVEFEPSDFAAFVKDPKAANDWMRFIEFSPANEKEYEVFIMSLQNKWEPVK